MTHASPKHSRLSHLMPYLAPLSWVQALSSSLPLCLTQAHSLWNHEYPSLSLPHFHGLTSCAPLKIFFHLLILSASKAVKCSIFFLFTLTVLPCRFCSLLSTSRCQVIFFSFVMITWFWFWFSRFCLFFLFLSTSSGNN